MFALMSKHDTVSYRTLGYVQKNLFFLAFAKYRYKCYYSVLGLDSSASPSDIKSAYYKLSMKFHPDRNSGCPEAVDKFREITEAYEILSNSDKKLKYDQGNMRSQYQRPSEGFPFGRERQRTTYTYREPRPPRTGRSQEFNYDEHFQKHYEEVFRRNEEYLRTMRAARMRWEREQYSDPYSRQSRRHPGFQKTDSFGGREVRRLPWSIFIMFYAAMMIFFLAEISNGDVPRPPDPPGRSNK